MKYLSSLFVVLLFTVSCTGNRTLDLIKGINDVSSTAITANTLPPPNTLSDEWTAIILTVNRQLLDIIQANPQDLKSQLTVVITNARQALPQPLNTKIDGYLILLEGLIKEIK